VEISRDPKPRSKCARIGTPHFENAPGSVFYHYSFGSQTHARIRHVRICPVFKLAEWPGERLILATILLALSLSCLESSHFVSPVNSLSYNSTFGGAFHSNRRPSTTLSQVSFFTTGPTGPDCWYIVTFAPQAIPPSRNVVQQTLIGNKKKPGLTIASE
jgi:hypothetical protein